MKENVRKFEKALREDEELRARFAAEFKRIAEEKSAGSDAEAYVKAAKALGFEFSLSEVEKASAETQELDPEEMGKATGGVDGDGKQDDVGWCISLYACFTIHHHDTPDREGYPCFADYDCITIYHH